MIKQSSLSKIKALLSKSKYQIDITIEKEDSLLFRFWNCTPIQNMKSESIKTTVSLFKGKKYVSKQINGVDIKGIEKTIEELKDTLKTVDYNPYIMPLKKGTFNIQSNTKMPTVKQVADNIKEICKLSSTVSITGTAGYTDNYLYKLNSKGLFAFTRRTKEEYSITTDYKDYKGGGEIISTSKINKKDIIKMAQEAIETAKMNAKKHRDIKPGTYTVLLSPLAFNQFLSMFGWLACDAYAYMEKRSPASKYLGKQIGSPIINITENPLDKQIFHASPFDNEGTKSKIIPIIEKGVFKNILTDRFTSKALKMPLTGHQYRPGYTGPSAIVVDNGEKTEKELLKEIKNGLYIKELHYINIIDPMDLIITGMTRNGLFLVKNGEIVAPLNNMRFTTSVIDFLKNVVALSSDIHIGDFMITPAALSTHFHISSKSTF